MRLERIRAICDDENAPKDFRDVFLKILPDEEFHEYTFKKSEEEYEHTRGNHELGRKVLGLVV